MSSDQSPSTTITSLGFTEVKQSKVERCCHVSDCLEGQWSPIDGRGLNYSIVVSRGRADGNDEAVNTNLRNCM